MHERWLLSRRKFLHALVGSGVIAATDLAWWEAPLISPRKAWGAEPVRFQFSVPEPTRITLVTSLVQRFNQSQKDFEVKVEFVPQAQARQKLISAISARQPARCLPGVGQLAGPVPGHGRGGGPHEPRQGMEAPAGRAGHRLADGDGGQSDRLAAVGAHARCDFLPD